MIADEIKVTRIGGPTALLEVAGLRILTDPTFDPKGTDYETSVYVLHKFSDPAIPLSEIGKIDLVLLSHDHHFDNLDHLGRSFLSSVDKVFTTKIGAERIGGNAIGLQNWETSEIETGDGRVLVITATPCRHGPAGGDRGPVIGFVLNYKDDPRGAVYVTGDTVWFEGVEEVAKKFDVRKILLFMGAAVVKEVGTAHLTMTVEESLLALNSFPNAQIIPLHFEGWAHFPESYREIENGYAKAGQLSRLIWT